MDELIAALRANTEANAALAEAINVQAGAIHALADALAACTSDPIPEQESEPVAASRYMDGSLIG